jgi:hypothetical protein
MRRIVRLSLVILIVAIPSGEATEHAVRRMSFHNRLLLNRAAVSGLTSVEVLVLAKRSDAATFTPSIEQIARLTRHVGGEVRRTEPEIGYLVVNIPTVRILELVDSPAIDACQIASLSKAAWYRDGPPLTNAEMFRSFEVTPIAAAEATGGHPGLPPLSVEESREPGYTADNDVGLRKWMAAHPTFDGRGVTIALVESAFASFTDPTLRSAMTLDGHVVPKLAGIVNSMDPELDDSRVVLDTEIRSETTWVRLHGRTYILPRAGTYRFGTFVLPAGDNVVHQFAVIEDERTREVWIDRNGDASFQDESPLVDVNERFDPRSLSLSHPHKLDVSFVMARGAEPDIVHIYVARGSGHQMMTVSVAAGGKTEDSLAYGVAPNARVVLVRADGPVDSMRGILEGFVAAAQRPDVDVISASAGFRVVPDTASDFLGLFFRRLTDVHGKVIVNGAGNMHLQLATATPAGSSLSVGGSLGPETFATLYGGRRLDGLLVHPVGAAGPGLDGSIKPDFLAPMERLAADLPWKRDLEAVPSQAPTRSVPPGYQASCCTSASSPYAAGVAALLISAARQTKTDYSVDDLVRAMQFSARFLPGFGSHEQGHGVLDINAAWQELTHGAAPPRMVSSARVTHPLTQYAAGGSQGVGIFEFEGWDLGTIGTRHLQLRRESGPTAPVTYRVTWKGNDGTFKTVSRVTLPLGTSVALPIAIAPADPGAHSALLELREPASGDIVFRTQATVVAAGRIDPTAGSFRTAGRIGLMRTNSHFVRIPEGTAAVAFELEVMSGVVKPTILPASGLLPAYYNHAYPSGIRSLAAGKHVVTLPNPEPGIWTVLLSNRSTWLHLPDDPPPDDRDAEYRLSIRVAGAAITIKRTPTTAQAMGAARSVGGTHQGSHQ